MKGRLLVSVETTCVDCDRAFLAIRYPYLYCSEACKQTAHLVRWARRKIADGTFLRVDIAEAHTLKLAHILAGGYPEAARRVPRATRELVIERAGGTCEHCGELFQSDSLEQRASIQHVAGSSNDPANLQAIHFACNTRDALGKLVPVTDPAKLALAAAIEARWKAPVALRLCDDERTWPQTWRKTARQRDPNRPSFFRRRPRRRDRPDPPEWITAGEEAFDRAREELLDRFLSGGPVDEREIVFLEDEYDQEGAYDELEELRNAVSEWESDAATASFVYDVVCRVRRGEEVSDDDLEVVYAEYGSYDMLEVNEA
jgi:hypothetical protein